ncbi:KAT8 regulatory NSL complex subunit 3 [Schistocerca americana]|uniref:KAT8 regulatory NSL complex subunit 3 n=1 Tax=Schistocerca americana TaxID=7009 RepID=UPI001F500812|nr:KAT8 regulatory NSL complex subunit 3 [Schistocerca americana]
MKGRDSLMKKLLSAPNIHGAVSSSGSTAAFVEGLYNAQSPAVDAAEENCTKLSRFLSQLAKECGREINMVMLDHAYSKPGDWSPENTYLKPTKKLFMFNFSPTENFWKSKAGIDIEEEPTTLTPPYNKEITSRLMRECEAFVKSIRREDKGDDWEDKIDKSNWTAQQIRLFSKAVRALNQDRLSRLLCEGSPSEAAKRRIVADTTARRLRQLLASVNWEMRLVQWLHTTLVDTLSNAYLAAYLDALQALKAKVPTLTEGLIGGTSRSGVSDAVNIVMKHPWDPVFECINENKPRRLPGNPIMLVVPSHPVLGGSHSPRMRQWESYLSALGTVVTVVLKAGNETAKASLSTCLDQMLCAARMKTAQVRAEYPGKPVILVGWNAGAAIACQVALLEQVQAVVCMGFSVHTVEGKRGEANDTLLDIRCPVFFVIGENAATSRCEDIEEIREKMRVETGLVVVGAADDQLRMSKLTKFRAGVTQTMVDYCIMDEVAEFLGTLLITPRPQLRPITNHTVTAASSVTENSVTNKLEGKRKLPFTEMTSSSVKRPRSDISQHAATSTPNQPAPGLESPPKSSLSTLPTYVSVSNTGSVRGGRQKSRVMGLQKLQGSQETKWTNQKVGSEQGSATNGITVNLGSLGSLAPLGPLRLGHVAGSDSQQLTETERQPVAHGRGTGGTSLTIQGGVVSSGGIGVAETRVGGRGSGKTSVSLQGKHARTVGAATGKTLPDNQLTSLSSLLQGGAARLVVSSASSLLLGQASSAVSLVTTTAGQQAKAQGSGTRVRTSSGRVVDLSKLTVLTSGASGITSTTAKNVLGTTSSGNVVMLASTSNANTGVRVGGQQVLVPVSGNQSFTVLPRQRSYAVVPKISVPSLKLSNEQQLSHTGTKLPGYTVAPTQLRNTHQREESSVPPTVTSKARDDDDTLTPDKILELPIIFAKDGDNLFLDPKSESAIADTAAVSMNSCTTSDVSLQQKVTVGDTISFPLEDSEREGALESKTCSSVGNMPNVYIIRSNRGRGRGSRRYVPKAQRVLQTTNKTSHITGNQNQGVKYTKIILTNKNSPLKIGERDAQGKDIHSLQQGISRIDSDQSSDEICDSPSNPIHS